MIIRTCATIAAIALIAVATASSAFACNGAHAKASSLTKVSYAAPAKQTR